jgi:endonuclease/exonuclease/phosphatase family metal-dependent hydrolase
MNHWRAMAVVVAVMVLCSGALLWSAQPARDPTTLVLASWNMEWLLTPTTAHASRLVCRAGQRAVLPCDVVGHNARNSADIARLAAYARQLDADVIAFQEVENADIASRVFKDYRICIAHGHGFQQVGFAIRPDIPHRCGPQLDALELQARSRAGMMLVVDPDSPARIELLAVHLKSGCARPGARGGTACTLLQSQAEVLQDWVAPRVAQRARFILLGDFNRQEPGADADPFWSTLLGSKVAVPAESPLINAAAGTPFRNCYIGQPFSRYIDHILVSAALAPALAPGSFQRTGFSNQDAVRYHLSDHCPVKVSLRRGDQRSANHPHQ